MRRRWLIWSVVAAAPVLASAVLFYVAWHPEAWVPIVHAGSIRDGQRIIRMAEVFRSRMGRVPASAEELGIPDNGAPYYERISDDRYIVYFSFVLGESYTYDSGDRRWEARNVVVDAKWQR